MATLPEMWHRAIADDAWAEIIAVVDRERVFSPNEDLDEVPTSALRYALAPYRHAQAMLKDANPSRRARTIHRASSEINRFLELCRIWRVFVPTEDGDVDNRRCEKIADFKRRKKIQERLKLIESIRELRHLDADSGDDLEEIEREYWLLQIEDAARDAQRTLSMNERELEMLQYRHAVLEQDRKGETKPSQPPVPMKTFRINKDMSLEKVMLGNKLDRRQKIRAEVFRDRNLPAMALTEFADMKLADAQERQRRQQGQVASNSSDESDSDYNTCKQRAWDNWKDDHEKGIGNRGYL